MLEQLNQVCDSISETDEESCQNMRQYYSVCLRGINPFKDTVLKKAGVDARQWKTLLKTLGGDL